MRGYISQTCKRDIAILLGVSEFLLQILVAAMIQFYPMPHDNFKAAFVNAFATF